MGRKPILCPHGILGKTKCKRCVKEYQRRYRQTHLPYFRNINNKRYQTPKRKQYLKDYDKERRRKKGEGKE